MVSRIHRWAVATLACLAVLASQGCGGAGPSGSPAATPAPSTPPQPAPPAATPPPAVTPPPPVTPRSPAGVTLTASLPSPQVAGTFVAFTAAGTGTSASEYRFSISGDGGLTYAVVQDWSVATTWTTPASLAAGTFRVLVEERTSPGAASGAQATLDLVLGPAPADPFVAAVAPATGSTVGATTVTVSGGNFVPGTVVTLGGEPQRIVSLTPTAITLVTSPGIAGAVDVAVTTPSNQAAIVPGGFTYVLPVRTSPPPPPPPPPAGPLPPATGVTLAAALPSPQVAGTFVPFVAAGGGSHGYEYRFSRSVDGGLSFEVAQDWSPAATWTTPGSLAAGGYRIRAEVRTNPGVVDAQAELDFTLTPAPPAPVITSISPDTGSTAGSTTVTIGGAGFTPGLRVLLGTRRQAVLSVTPTVITLVTAPAVAGPVDVAVVTESNEAALRPGGFDYLLPVR